MKEGIVRQTVNKVMRIIAPVDPVTKALDERSRKADARITALTEELKGLCEGEKCKVPSK